VRNSVEFDGRLTLITRKAQYSANIFPIQSQIRPRSVWAYILSARRCCMYSRLRAIWYSKASSPWISLLTEDNTELLSISKWLIVVMMKRTRFSAERIYPREKIPLIFLRRGTCAFKVALSIWEIISDSVQGLFWGGYLSFSYGCSIHAGSVKMPYG